MLYAQTCRILNDYLLLQNHWTELLQPDGVHFSQKGAVLVHKHIAPLLEKLVRAFLPWNMGQEELILPSVSLLSNKNPCPEIIEWLRDHK